MTAGSVPGQDVLDGDLACGCGRNGPAALILWCYAWQEYLCEACRWHRADKELGATERANAAALLAQVTGRYPAARQASQDRGGSTGPGGRA